ncbi:hypothetical protein H5410_029128, partial [Solanum commersonii]
NITQGVEVKIDAQVIFKRRSFKYFESIIQGDEKIDENVAYCNGQSGEVIRSTLLYGNVGQTRDFTSEDEWSGDKNV